MIAYDPLAKQKAPKALADALTWINTALTDFGITGIALRPLIDLLRLHYKIQMRPCEQVQPKL